MEDIRDENRSMLLVKPEASEKIETVLMVLRSESLIPGQKVRHVELDVDQAERLATFLYPRHCNAFRNAVWGHFRRKQIAFVIVNGFDAIRRLSHLVGDTVNPAHCADGTLRHAFGVREPWMLRDPERGIRFPYYQNAFSCPRSEKEASFWFSSGMAFP